MNEIINILGIEFRAIDLSNSKQIINNAIDNDLSLSVFTPNTEILMKARHNGDLKKMLNSAELLLPDGIGVIYASRILGSPLPERIAGIDMGEYLLRLAAERSLKVYLLGARPGVAELAAANLIKTFPKLIICGTHHGYFNKNGAYNSHLLSEINSAAPDILIVCFGAPAQEKWIYDNKHSLNSVRIIAGLGGSLDVWSGKVSRAPRIMQKLSLEWVWRIIRQPKRITFLFKIPIFLLAVYMQKRKNKHQITVKQKS